MSDFNEDLNKLKKLFQVKTDVDLAKKLSISLHTVRSWKERKILPEKYKIIGSTGVYKSKTGVQFINSNDNIIISLKKEDFKNDQKEVEQLLSLLKYAPKEFLLQIIERLREFEKLSRL